MYNDQLVYKVIIWASFGISLWKKNVALTTIQLWLTYLTMWAIGNSVMLLYIIN